MTMEVAAMGWLIGHKPPGTNVTRGKSSVALLIAYNLLGVSRATGFLGGLMRSAAAACSRVASRVALLGDCERGRSECDSDREA